MCLDKFLVTQDVFTLARFEKVSHGSCVLRHGPQEMETTVTAVSSFHPLCYTLDVELGKLVRWSPR